VSALFEPELLLATPAAKMNEREPYGSRALGCSYERSMLVAARAAVKNALRERCAPQQQEVVMQEKKVEHKNVEHEAQQEGFQEEPAEAEGGLTEAEGGDLTVAEEESSAAETADDGAQILPSPVETTIDGEASTIVECQSAEAMEAPQTRGISIRQVSLTPRSPYVTFISPIYHRHLFSADVNQACDGRSAGRHASRSRRGGGGGGGVGGCGVDG
jgi:hypothetical protein|tara:strand:+ start:164 stop:811 length:648 start_codon:yes stop_codon:yes gene_type:complete